MRPLLAAIGLGLCVFAVASLTSPGRIDIVDGQTRYEVAKSLVEYGDVEVRLEDYWWCVFPGRDGRSFSSYRLPQSLWGVGAIHLADLFDPMSESRRHFFYSLIGPIHGALLAIAFVLVFRQQGRSLRTSVFWAACGVATTPAWFYSTTTFDDLLASAAVVWGLTFALLSERKSVSSAALVGVAMGWAFHCKQPLGVFILPAAVLLYQGSSKHRLIAMASFLLTFGLAIAGYLAFEYYKFPPGSTEGHAELLKRYAPIFFGNPLAALACFLFSPGTSFLLYCPPVILSIIGLRVIYRKNAPFVLSMLLAIAVYVGFVSLLTFFKGDPAWGPRYLTPVYCVLWLFAPTGALELSKKSVFSLLFAGLLIQLLAISVDQHRLFLQRELPSAYVSYRPFLCFHPATSHLLNRPREIAEILQNHDRSPYFTPARGPTYAMPLVEEIDAESDELNKYHVLNSLRPWWISQQYLNDDERPVDVLVCVSVLILIFFIGGTTLWLGLQR